MASPKADNGDVDKDDIAPTTTTTMGTGLDTTVPTLVFDDSCPMCQIYTGAFSKLGWADRQAFGSCDPDLTSQMDLDRARHEIPMFDPVTGQMQYGLDSLFTVIGGRLRWLRPLMALPIAKPAIRPIYALISYNRRQIAGCPPPSDGFDCAPDFHVAWVSTYIGLVGGATCALASTPVGAAAAITSAIAATARLGPVALEADRPKRFEVVSQAATSVLVGSAAARVAALCRMPAPVAAAIGIAAGVHQVVRRSFLRRG